MVEIALADEAAVEDLKLLLKLSYGGKLDTRPISCHVVEDLKLLLKLSYPLYCPLPQCCLRDDIFFSGLLFIHVSQLIHFALPTINTESYIMDGGNLLDRATLLRLAELADALEFGDAVGEYLKSLGHGLTLESAITCPDEIPERLRECASPLPFRSR